MLRPEFGPWYRGNEAAVFNRPRRRPRSCPPNGQGLRPHGTAIPSRSACRAGGRPVGSAPLLGRVSEHESPVHVPDRALGAEATPVAVRRSHHGGGHPALGVVLRGGGLASIGAALHRLGRFAEHEVVCCQCIRVVLRRPGHWALQVHPSLGGQGDVLVAAVVGVGLQGLRQPRVGWKCSPSPRAGIRWSNWVRNTPGQLPRSHFSVMGENIESAGSNRVICRGSPACRIVSLSSMIAACYDARHSITPRQQVQAQSSDNAIYIQSL